MDKVSIVVATPSVGQSKFSYTMSLAHLALYFAQARIYPEVGVQQLSIIGMEGSGVSHAREEFVRATLADKDATHLMFIDEDMTFPPHAMHMLARRRQPIVGANYRKRSPPGEFMAIDFDMCSRVETTKNSAGLQPVLFMGFGFCLMERKVLEAMRRPMFNIEWKEDAESYTTEDHIFFREAAKLGFTCYVDHDVSKEVGHIGNMEYKWDKDYAPFGKRDVKITI